MAQRTKKVTQTTPTTPEQEEEHPKHAPYPKAREHNFGLARNPRIAAQLTKTDKGTNPKRNRVYGYDNGTDGGGVPRGAVMVLVPGAPSSPVATYVKAHPKGTVQDAYDAKALTSRQVRRAFRKGHIRFKR